MEEQKDLNKFCENQGGLSEQEVKQIMKVVADNVLIDLLPADRIRDDIRKIIGASIIRCCYPFIVSNPLQADLLRIFKEILQLMKKRNSIQRMEQILDESSQVEGKKNNQQNSSQKKLIHIISLHFCQLAGIIDEQSQLDRMVENYLLNRLTKHCILQIFQVFFTIPKDSRQLLRTQLTQNTLDSSTKTQINDFLHNILAESSGKKNFNQFEQLFGYFYKQSLDCLKEFYSLSKTKISGSEFEETISLTMIGLAILIRIFCRIKEEEDQRLNTLHKRMIKLINQLEEYSETYQKEYFFRPVHRIYEQNKEPPFVYFQILNRFLILDILKTYQMSNLTVYEKFKKTVQVQHGQIVYDLKIASKRGQAFGGFHSIQNSQQFQITYLYGMKVRISLIRDMIQGLLQSQKNGILHTDIKFRNQVKFGKSYYLIDFQHSYKFFLKESWPESNKYFEIQHQYKSLTESSKKQMFEKYKSILFQTPRNLDGYADPIRKQLQKYLPCYLYFPYQLSIQQFQEIKKKISRRHTEQLTYQLQKIFPKDQKHLSYDRMYHLKQEILNLIEKVKTPKQDEEKLSLADFLRQFQQISFKYPTLQKQLERMIKFSQLPIEKYSCEFCSKKFLDCRFIKMDKLKIGYMCEQCGAKINIITNHTPNSIVIDLQNPFSSNQTINFNLLAARANFKQAQFQIRVFSDNQVSDLTQKDYFEFNFILKYCLLIDIYQKHQNIQSEEKAYNGLEHLIDCWIQFGHSKKLEDLLNYYLKFYKSDAQVQTQAIQLKYLHYPFDFTFQMQNSWQKITNLHYNDKLLTLIFDQIINTHVKGVMKVYFKLYTKLLYFKYYLKRISEGIFTITEVIHDFENRLKQTKPVKEDFQQSFQQQFQYIKKKANKIWAKKMNKKIQPKIKKLKKTKKSQISTISITQLVQTAQNATQATIRQLKKIRKQQITNFQEEAINQARLLHQLGFKKLIVQQTSHIQSYLYWKTVQEILNKEAGQISFSERIEAITSKIYDLSSKVNDYKCGIYFYDCDSSYLEIQSLKTMPNVRSLYFKGKSKIKTQKLSKQMRQKAEMFLPDFIYYKEKRMKYHDDSNSGRDEQMDQQQLRKGKEELQEQQFEDMPDEQQYSSSLQEWKMESQGNTQKPRIIIQCMAQNNFENIQCLVLSYIIWNNSSYLQLTKLFSKASKLIYLSLKRCRDFDTKTFKQLNSRIKTILLKDNQYQQIDSFHLEDTLELKSLAIQQLDKQGWIGDKIQKYLDFSNLRELEYLRLKWFPNCQISHTYFLSLRLQNLFKIKHLTLKTNRITSQVLTLISRMKSLEVLNLKAYEYDLEVTQIIELLDKKTPFITFKIQKMVCPDYLREKKPIHLMHDYFFKDESDQSSQQSQSSQSDFNYQDEPQILPDVQNCYQEIRKFCSISFSQLLCQIIQKWPSIKFLRLRLPQTQAQTPQFLNDLPFIAKGIKKLEIDQRRLDSNTIQSLMENGTIVKEHGVI